jgi:hypothetical protein
MNGASDVPAEEPVECTLRIARGTIEGNVEVSIDGAEYRPCRLEDGAWSLRWVAALRGAEPVVAVIRATE